MFKILFHYPRVLARHCQGPSAQARERYLTHCADQGTPLDSLLGTARELLAIAQRLDLTTDQMICIKCGPPHLIQENRLSGSEGGGASALPTLSLRCLSYRSRL